MNTTNGKQSYHHGNLRAELLEVAERVLREQGLDKVTLRELAREIGVSHTAPQRHFKNRQELLDAVAEQGFNQLGTLLQAELTTTKGDFFEQIRSSVLAFVRFATQNASLFELMNSSKHNDSYGTVMAASNVAFAPMITLIQDGQKQGVIEAGDPEEIGLILYATLLGITTMVNGNLLEADKLEELVLSALTHFLRGARPE